MISGSLTVTQHLTAEAAVKNSSGVNKIEDFRDNVPAKNTHAHMFVPWLISYKSIQSTSLDLIVQQ